MPRRNGHNENRFGHDFLLPALVSFSCLRQIRIMSKSSGRENSVSLASGSPASAFIGRDTVASFTPGRMRSNRRAGASVLESVVSKPFATHHLA
jgi:hypothetical protein